MSQDLRDYDLFRVDEVPEEATRMSLTATVGPSGHGEMDDKRGVQITLETPDGVAYARVSEPQVRDLIDVLQWRVDAEDEAHEATAGDGDRVLVSPRGEHTVRDFNRDTPCPECGGEPDSVDPDGPLRSCADCQIVYHQDGTVVA